MILREADAKVDAERDVEDEENADDAQMAGEVATIIVTALIYPPGKNEDEQLSDCCWSQLYDQG